MGGMKFIDWIRFQICKWLWYEMATSVVEVSKSIIRPVVAHQESLAQQYNATMIELQNYLRDKTEEKLKLRQVEALEKIAGYLNSLNPK